MIVEVLDLFAANLRERAVSVETVGDNVYAVLENEPRVLKVAVAERAGEEVRITLSVISPDHGPIDAAGFLYHRSQRSSEALVQLDRFMSIWFD